MTASYHYSTHIFAKFQLDNENVHPSSVYNNIVKQNKSFTGNVKSCNIHDVAAVIYGLHQVTVCHMGFPVVQVNVMKPMSERPHSH